MVAAIVQFDFNVQHREASQRTFFHHQLEAFLDGWEEFFRDVTANNCRFKVETGAGLARLNAVINLTKLA